MKRAALIILSVTFLSGSSYATCNFTNNCNRQGDVQASRQGDISRQGDRQGDVQGSRQGDISRQGDRQGDVQASRQGD